MNVSILLVDDEKDFIESLAQRLELRDFNVKTAFLLYFLRGVYIYSPFGELVINKNVAPRTLPMLRSKWTF